ncbi:MAG TPA: hypothetical protein VK893_08510, partial [Pyrinomonadaceae bacterium]|nr:hypothetical protein [Pyrinomonadaceae bacterium]
ALYSCVWSMSTKIRGDQKVEVISISPEAGDEIKHRNYRTPYSLQERGLSLGRINGSKGK